ncbi:MAG: hypothetical protein JW810_10685 [Sedimentisphaerales bacterium]|nr:hypothetical protein [Sedimentisphaerales bacterium]
MTRFDDETTKPDSLLKRWRDGRLSNQSQMATVAMALVLVGTILAARLLVHARSGRLEAIENTCSMLEKLRNEGIGAYLPNEVAVRYYIIETDGKEQSFSVELNRPDKQNPQWFVFEGMDFDPKEQILKRHRLLIETHLREYEYRIHTQALAGGQVEIYYQKYAAGSLAGYYQLGLRRILLKNPQLPGYAIPPPLLDFLSSVGIQKADENGVLLAVPMITKNGLEYRQFEMVDAWVRPTGQTPESLATEFPGGRSVHVDWPPGDHTQEIYYDGDHQLVWQKDLPANSVRRKVSRAELVERFGVAQTLIPQWLGETAPEDNSNEAEAL